MHKSFRTQACVYLKCPVAAVSLLVPTETLPNVVDIRDWVFFLKAELFVPQGFASSYFVSPAAKAQS